LIFRVEVPNELLGDGRAVVKAIRFHDPVAASCGTISRFRTAVKFYLILQMLIDPDRLDISERTD
jgi:hypothetical protein